MTKKVQEWQADLFSKDSLSLKCSARESGQVSTFKNVRQAYQEWQDCTWFSLGSGNEEHFQWSPCPFSFAQVYADYESNPQLRQAIEFACRQFYVLHRKPFILQLFASVAPLLEFPVSKSHSLVSAWGSLCMQPVPHQRSQRENSWSSSTVLIEHVFTALDAAQNHFLNLFLHASVHQLTEQNAEIMGRWYLG